jgi:plastocyanin
MAIITRPVLGALGVVAAVTLGACAGDGGEKQSAGSTETSAPSIDAAPSTDAAATTLAVEAHDISLSPTDLRAAPGSVAVRYTNAGAIQHTLLIDGISGFKLDVASAGDVDTATVQLEPGTYTLYCDVPGHRAAGMEAQLTVS